MFVHLYDDLVNKAGQFKFVVMSKMVDLDFILSDFEKTIGCHANNILNSFSFGSPEKEGLFDSPFLKCLPALNAFFPMAPHAY